MERVDVLLVCEVDDAVEPVVLDELERGIHLVRAVVKGGGRRSVEHVAAPDVAVDDGGAAQGGGGLGRWLACLDDDPEHRRLDEAQRLAHPGEVEGLRGAGARGRDDDEQLVWVGGEVDGGRGGGRGRVDEVVRLREVGEEVEQAEEGAEEEEGGEARERAAGEEEEGVRVAAGGLPRRGGGVAERGGGGGEGLLVPEQVLLRRRVRSADGRHRLGFSVAVVVAPSQQESNFSGWIGCPVMIEDERGQEEEGDQQQQQVVAGLRDNRGANGGEMSKTAARTQQDRESGLVWIERPGAEDGRRPGNQTEIDTPVILQVILEGVDF
jgi:hypothetical protein